jgi:hypothetical protein
MSHVCADPTTERVDGAGLNLHLGEMGKWDENMPVYSSQIAGRDLFKTQHSRMVWP